MLSPSSDAIISALISKSRHSKNETPDANPNPDAKSAVGILVAESDDAATAAAAAPEEEKLGKRSTRFALLRMTSKKSDAQSAVAMP
mmetsp:Transcript_8616/g.19364  ORF Transcript_8616/g.19364 Transcript_8616/m.19364 type:complete len:87 (+) Transcript_8616:882-1142(+)